MPRIQRIIFPGPFIRQRIRLATTEARYKQISAYPGIPFPFFPQTFGSTLLSFYPCTYTLFAGTQKTISHKKTYPL